MKILRVDEKWSIEYDDTYNDRPRFWLRYGQRAHRFDGNNGTTALFYALLAASQERKPPELMAGEEAKALLAKAEWLWDALQGNNIGGFSGPNRPFYILHAFREVLEEFGRRDTGLRWTKDQLDALSSGPGVDTSEAPRAVVPEGQWDPLVGIPTVDIDRGRGCCP